MARHPELCDRPALVQSLDVIPVAGCVRVGVERTMAHEAAAIDTGYQPDYWSKVLKSERGIALDRLGRLPLETQREIVIAWAQQLGLTVERRDMATRRAAVQKLAEAALAIAEIL